MRPGLERAAQGARASGTPFISFFTPAEMLALAREAGFREVEHVSAATSPSATSRAGPTAFARRKFRGAAGRDDVMANRRPTSSTATSMNDCNLRWALHAFSGGWLLWLLFFRLRAVPDRHLSAPKHDHLYSFPAISGTRPR